MASRLPLILSEPQAPRMRLWRVVICEAFPGVWFFAAFTLLEVSNCSTRHSKCDTLVVIAHTVVGALAREFEVN